MTAPADTRQLVRCLASQGSSTVQCTVVLCSPLRYWTGLDWTFVPPRERRASKGKNTTPRTFVHCHSTCRVYLPGEGDLIPLPSQPTRPWGNETRCREGATAPLRRGPSRSQGPVQPAWQLAACRIGKCVLIGMRVTFPRCCSCRIWIGAASPTSSTPVLKQRASCQLPDATGMQCHDMCHNMCQKHRQHQLTSHNQWNQNSEHHVPHSRHALRSPPRSDCSATQPPPRPPTRRAWALSRDCDCLCLSCSLGIGSFFNIFS